MKGAFLMSEDVDLFDRVSEVLRDRGAVTSPDKVTQLTDHEGRLLTIYGDLDPDLDWEWRGGNIVMVDGSAPPPLSAMTACLVECRWEDLFALTMATIGVELAATAWVLDGDGVLWPAQEVDPESVTL
ncbi:hypothetical protein [Kribbella sp. NPDC051620]|uniref:hypothetical protein n=1 Tax=Kribbella sp. NPDC051620 TaxID=3364120 RepID=UPI0037A009D2